MVMDTKVLLRLIKDDIKILDNINESFINQSNLTSEEAEVALARAKALVMEFEMLSKNLSREQDPQDLNESENPEEKSEKKVHSLRNLLPFVKSEPKEEENSLKDNPERTTEKFRDLIQETSPEEKLSNNTIQSTVIEDSTRIESSNISIVSALEDAEETNIIIEEKRETIIVDQEPGDKKLSEESAENSQYVNNLLSKEKDEVKFGIIPLKNIREGIGLNDRFLYIRELFQNDAEKFDRTITTLDEFNGIEEAVRFLKQNFKWNKSEAGEKFLLLIKRRFTKQFNG